MSRGIGEWIRGHPVVAFFLLAVVIMFGLAFPAVLVVPQDTTFGQILGFYMGRLAVFSPVLAAVFVTRMGQPKRRRLPLSRSATIFFPAWVISVFIQTATIKQTAPPSAALIALVVISLPVGLLPALIISMAFSGSPRRSTDVDDFGQAEG